MASGAVGSEAVDDEDGGGSMGSGTYDQAVISGSDNFGVGGEVGSDVWHTIQDLARVAVALVFMLAFAFAIGATVRQFRPTPVHAAVLVTSQGDVLPSAGTCDQDSARLDVDNLPCHHAGPR
jgi:hypothetical protein